MQRVGVARDNQVLCRVVNEVALCAVGAVALEVELAAEFHLVLGVATGLAQLTQAMGKLVLSRTAAASTL